MFFVLFFQKNKKTKNRNMFNFRAESSSEVKPNTSIRHELKIHLKMRRKNYIFFFLTDVIFCEKTKSKKEKGNLSLYLALEVE